MTYILIMIILILIVINLYIWFPEKENYEYWKGRKEGWFAHETMVLERIKNLGIKDKATKEQIDTLIYEIIQ